MINKINFLLVDDEEFVTNGLKRLLYILFENIGEVFTAPTPIDAIEILNREDICIVFTDIKMPKMSGLEFMELLNREYPHCRVVVLSGYGNFEYAQKAISNNIKAYLLKPVTKNELEQVIGELLRSIESENESDRVKNEILDALASGNGERVMEIITTKKEELVSNGASVAVMRTVAMEIVSVFMVFAHERGIEPTALFIDGNMPIVAVSTCETTENMFDLLVHINDKIMGYTKSSSAEDSENVIESIKRYILQNLDRDITLDTLSEVVYLTPNYISAVFKKMTGISYKEYLLRERLKRAKELLAENNMKIYEVATAVGYKDSTHFSKVFKQHIGVYPSEFRGE